MNDKTKELLYDLFSFNGKMGRLKYFLYTFLLLLILLLILLFVGWGYNIINKLYKETGLIILIIAAIVYLWIYSCLTIKRARDIDKNGLLLFFFIFLQMIFLIYLYFIPGKKVKATEITGSALEM